MTESRSEQRLLCSDLIAVQVEADDGRTQEVVANLEDISLSGACLHSESAISPGTRVRLVFPRWQFRGEARYCHFQQAGYFLVGVQFAPENAWHKEKFEPEHLLDPRLLGKF